MAEFNVRLASKGEIRGISDWFLEERSKYPGMAQLVGGGVRGWMVRSVVTPRYLRKAAYTYVLEQDGKTGGFAVVEQGGLAVNLSDFAIREGFDRAGLVKAMLAQVEQLARDASIPMCAQRPGIRAKPHWRLSTRPAFSCSTTICGCLPARSAASRRPKT